ncbi:MAG TPA: helix-turn-helix transcriptional regulator [Lacipirellulaceae bacterium]|jgi:DNA-binding XRE family transcriptional regulator
MIALQHIQVAGQRFVLIEEAEYERLRAQAGEQVPVTGDGLPPLPEQDERGRFPALEYARISLARDIIRDRRAVGLTQHELAKLAGTRQETISRIENGKYTASVKLIDKIDRVLQGTLKKRRQLAAKRKSRRARPT